LRNGEAELVLSAKGGLGNNELVVLRLLRFKASLAIPRPDIADHLQPQLSDAVRTYGCQDATLLWPVGMEDRPSVHAVWERWTGDGAHVFEMGVIHRPKADVARILAFPAR